MPRTLTLRVITPERIVYDETAEAVRIPGLDGQIGILPRHAPMIAALSAGVVRYRAGGREALLFVSGGFAEVRADTLRLVTRAGELAGEIDEERARAAEERARERIEVAREGGAGAQEIDLIRAEAAFLRALQRLRTREAGSR